MHGACAYAPVQKPPPLDWDVLSTLTHLSNMERVPLPMILHVARGEDGGAEARHQATGQSKTSKFFTISKKGRTAANFQETGTSPSDEDDADRARLPNYLSNPYSAILFGASQSNGTSQLKKKSRRKSSVAPSRHRAGSVFGSTASGVHALEYYEDGSIPEFLSSTFTRSGLNVTKLRDFEVRSSARERDMRLQQEGSHDGGDGDDQGWQVVDYNAPAPQVHYSTPRLSQHLSVDVAPLHDTTHPRLPRGLQQLLHNSQLANGHNRREDVNWISEYSRGTMPVDGHVVPPSPLHRREVALTLTSLSDERGCAYPLPPSPRRPQAHPMLRNPRAPRRHSEGASVQTVTPRTPNQKLRELGSEIKLRV